MYLMTLICYECEEGATEISLGYSSDKWKCHNIAEEFNYAARIYDTATCVSILEKITPATSERVKWLLERKIRFWRDGLTSVDESYWIDVEEINDISDQLVHL